MCHTRKEKKTKEKKRKKFKLRGLSCQELTILEPGQMHGTNGAACITNKTPHTHHF